MQKDIHIWQFHLCMCQFDTIQVWGTCICVMYCGTKFLLLLEEWGHSWKGRTYYVGWLRRGLVKHYADKSLHKDRNTMGVGVCACTHVCKVQQFDKWYQSRIDWCSDGFSLVKMWQMTEQKVLIPISFWCSVSLWRLHTHTHAHTLCVCTLRHKETLQRKLHIMYARQMHVWFCTCTDCVPGVWIWEQ